MHVSTERTQIWANPGPALVSADAPDLPQPLRDRAGIIFIDEDEYGGPGVRDSVIGLAQSCYTKQNQ